MIANDRSNRPNNQQRLSDRILAYTIQNLADIDPTPPSTTLCWRNRRLDQRPFCIGQVAWITQTAPISSAAVFRFPHLAPPALMRVPGKESQPIPLTQQLSGSALKLRVIPNNAKSAPKLTPTKNKILNLLSSGARIPLNRYPMPIAPNAHHNLRHQTRDTEIRSDRGFWMRERQAAGRRSWIGRANCSSSVAQRSKSAASASLPCAARTRLASSRCSRAACSYNSRMYSSRGKGLAIDIVRSRHYEVTMRVGG